MIRLLQYDTKIQEASVYLFLLAIIFYFFFNITKIGVFVIISFFVIATSQYVLNILKFFNQNYRNTISRKIYILLSTLVVLFLLSTLILFHLESNLWYRDMAAICLFLAPVLIVYSLLISYADKKEKIEGLKNDTII